MLSASLPFRGFPRRAKFGARARHAACRPVASRLRSTSDTAFGLRLYVQFWQCSPPDAKTPAPCLAPVGDWNGELGWLHQGARIPGLPRPRPAIGDPERD